jgi:hypothetical protein
VYKLAVETSLAKARRSTGFISPRISRVNLDNLITNPRSVAKERPKMSRLSPDLANDGGAVAVPTAYTAHASGAVAVVSEAATDLDTTAAALKTLRDEVAALIVVLQANGLVV